MNRRAIIILATVGSFIAGSIVISSGGPDGGGEIILPDGGIIAVDDGDPVADALDAGAINAVGNSDALCPPPMFLCPDGICQDICE